MKINNFDSAILATFDFDIQKISNYYLDELNFEGVVIYKDKPNVFFDSHSHPSDNYLYMLEGTVILNENNEKIILNKGDFYYVKSGVYHDALIGENGAKYIVASPNGDFSTTFFQAEN
jgi:quercetin dioxygenase-like cupin family protein